MLAPNSHNRLTIEEVLNHPWMRVSTIPLTNYSFVQKYKLFKSFRFKLNQLFVCMKYFDVFGLPERVKPLLTEQFNK